jgi:serine phosphatase RsbU (regulator of sigma subunit)
VDGLGQESPGADTGTGTEPVGTAARPPVHDAPEPTAPDQRAEAGNERDQAAARRDRVADARDHAAALRDAAADRRDLIAKQRDLLAAERDEAARRRDEADERFEVASNGTASGIDLRASSARRAAASDRRGAALDRLAVAGERTEAGIDRKTASADRRASARERGEAGIDRSAAAYDSGNSAELAHDNGRLYAQERTFSEALQRSLLTAPPQTAAMQIGVRYLPATVAFKVGGDWYDAFLTESGETVLVVGDVIGHDIEAAVLMGQLRTLVRAIAFTTNESPAAVLGRVQAGVDALAAGTMATAIVARVEVGGRTNRPGATHLRWSSAGHPPPVLLRPDGTVQVLDADDSDLMLGVDPVAPRTDRLVPLPEGSTVLLYTDGLVERRGSGLDEGIALLAATVRNVGRLPLERFCDEVLARMLPDEHEDDVALLAMRLCP